MRIVHTQVDDYRETTVGYADFQFDDRMGVNSIHRNEKNKIIV